MSGVRRVVIGTDASGCSAVVRDEQVVTPRVVRPNGAVVQEIWRQEALPARLSDEGGRAGELHPGPPPGGVSVRTFTLPPAVDGTPPQLAGGPSVYVAVVLSGVAHLVLETGEVLLRQGDTFVLPGSRHGWQNPRPEEAVVVRAVYPLAAGDAP